MIDIAVTKMSSKGQVVIPVSMRKSFRKGEKLVLIKSGDRLILKNASDLSKNLEEDLIFAKRTEEALKRYGKGKYKERDVEEFLGELETW